MNNLPTRLALKQRAQRFLNAKGVIDLSRLLRSESVKLGVLAEDPKYREYRIPKKAPGKFRHIEDPDPKLKIVQRHLNRYLQALYYQDRHPAVYGFLVSPQGDEQPRNILTNAERHLGCQWMLNVDMQDFFHLIKLDRVRRFFEHPPFQFGKVAVRRLSRLCCYRGRLPMGAPTSPIISNFVTRDLDDELQRYAEERHWTYTRYADDLTFSSVSEPISVATANEIAVIVKRNGFCLNPAKKVFYDPGVKEKQVTGLIVGQDRVSLSKEYLGSLRKSIKKLSEVIDAQYVMPSGRLRPTPWVKEIEQQVRGRLQFAMRVLPEDDDSRIELEMAFAEALEPPKSYGPISWLDFGYMVSDSPLDYD